jgi:hypothetical protein
MGDSAMKHPILLKRFLQLPEWLLIICLIMLNHAIFAQENGYWDDRFSAIPYKWNSDNAYWIDAIAVTDGGDIYASGLNLVGTIIKWNGKGWSSFGGKTGPVYAFATVGNDLYVGGGFIKADSIPANRIAKYNHITQKWSALETDGFNGINHQPDGYNRHVYAIAVHENNLYVGGNFTTAGAVNANNIAQWNIATKIWTSLGEGVNGTVYAIVVKNGEVYVGGGFSSVGGVSANNIAKWDGREWSALGAGVNGAVRALTICGEDLYVGGGFTKAGEANVRNIAKWNTVSQTWAPVGEGVWSASSVNSGSVSALASDGRVVYVGGKFGYADEMEAAYIVKWNPAKSCWSRLGRGLTSAVGISSMYTRVNSILIRENDVYVGGQFGIAGGKPSQLFAIWHEPASPSPHAPAWSTVPNVTFTEDDSTTLELYQYVTDTEHDLRGGLTFSATVINPPAAANSSDLQIRLEKVIMGPVGRYQYATFASTKEASGIYTVVFTVTDACGASASDTIQVTVTPVNDPPVISALPPITFNEDDSLLYSIRNWFDYVTDADNADNVLSFRIFSSRKVKAVRRGQSFLFTAAPNWVGTSKLKLIVKDRGGLADTTTLTVKVNPVNDPPVIRGLPDSLSFRNNTSIELNLWEFAHDVETPDSLLKFTFAANKKGLSMNFDKKTGLLRLSAPNFAGKNQLYVVVKDWKNLAVRDTIAIQIQSTTITNVAASDAQFPTEFVLLQNYPNPFNPTTQIRYELPKAAHVRVIIYNSLGQEIRRLVDRVQPAGYHLVTWNGRDQRGKPVPSGVYHYRLQAGDEVVATRKMLMAK